MADSTRKGKPSNNWTEAELMAYNLEIVEQSFVEFFNRKKLPSLPRAVRDFSATTTAMEHAREDDDNTWKLLYSLDLVELSIDGEEEVVTHLAVRLLRTLGYASDRRLIITHQILPFLNCGAEFPSWIDVCICDENDIILLLVQRVKQPLIRDDPVPQLIGGAIAAYQRNIVRQEELGLPIDDEITFPGIALFGSAPVFLKIKVTAELNRAVSGGTTPAHQVTVYRHYPRLPQDFDKGMDPLDNRSAILRYYKVFKVLV